LGFAALNPTYGLRIYATRLAEVDPSDTTEPARPAPVGGGRKNGRQPGNKPPPFERSVWAAPGW